MASIASPASGPPSEERRPQAGPLPRKRGEIGYQEGTDSIDDNTESTMALPARHPAEREPSPVSDVSSPGPPDTSSSSSPSSSSSSASSDSDSDSDASSMHKPPKRSTFLSWFDWFTHTKLSGINLSTIIRLTSQLLFLTGTITLWVIVTHLLAHTSTSPGSSSATGAPASQISPPPPALGGSAAIFVHVSFGIITLAQLLLLERCIFFVRAQRYAHTHPGATLPRHTRRSRSGSPMNGMAMGFTPWNRPPLPTYAAALAQSGVGTGDVEDNIIAIPPPPAYGNTRGSTLLLAGFLRNSLRAAAAENSQSSRPASQASRLTRPVSYRSHDEEWEERCDAERALRLAETLESLERSSQSATASNGQHRS